MTLPSATYRIQFRDGMTFDRAVEVVPYLKRLGVSHLYASPIFAATHGSTHGYDVTDHNRFDPALGGRDGFMRLSDALKAHGLGLILDIVPNHMAASVENPWWRSAVEWGEQSLFAHHFDIDWAEPLTLAMLGKPFEEALSAGELSLRTDAEEGALTLAYYDNLLPLTPATYGLVLEGIEGELAERLAEAAATAGARSGHGVPPAREGAAHRYRSAPAPRRKASRHLGRPRSSSPRARGAALAAGILEGGQPASQLSPLLRDHRAGGGEGGGPRRVRRRPPPGAGAGARGQGGRAAHRPCRRTCRPGSVSGAAAREGWRGHLHRRRKDRRARRDPAGRMAGRGDHRLRVHRRHGRASDRRRRCGGACTHLCGAFRRGRACRDTAPGGEAADGVEEFRRRGRGAGKGGAARGAGGFRLPAARSARRAHGAYRTGHRLPALSHIRNDGGDVRTRSPSAGGNGRGGA